MANSSLNVSTLDFNDIKNNLKNYLKSQDIFKDYDFDGSNISVLLDVLAYNTSLNAFYMNMLSAESYLDSAQLRNSVVSHAKDLNYLPKSARSSKAVIRIKATQNNSELFTIPKGTTFTTVYNSKTYTFSTDQIQSYYSSYDEELGAYVFETGDIDIFEGFYIDESFVMNYGNETQRFIISNENVDISSLVVNTIENNGSTTVNYHYSSTLLGLDSNSKSYFLQATENGKYEIVFGDDILGRRPPNSAVISVQYRIAEGNASNGASRFSIDLDLTNDSSGRIEITTISKADGGSIPESISSIKFNAPRHFQAQERAITTADYETLLKAKFNEIDSISVYGGEEINPPQYGKVFIAAKLSGIEIIPDSKVDEYTKFIKPKMANPVQPVFINPSYVYIKLMSKIKYNLNVTNLRPDEIKVLVNNKITQFNSDNLDKFNSTLYSSKLINTIDSSHSSIVSNITDPLIYKKIRPVLDAPQTFTIEYNIPFRNDIPEIAPNHHYTELRTIYSSPFSYKNDTAILEDDGVGNIRIMRLYSGGVTLIKNIGTVDYDLGVIQFSDFDIQSYEGSSLRIYALPSSIDVKSHKNDIITIEPSETIISVEAVRV